MTTNMTSVMMLQSVAMLSTLVDDNKSSKFQSMCSVSEYNEIGIEVHVGREHAENFECGLCGYIAEDLESLDVHLQTCEIY